MQEQEQEQEQAGENALGIVELAAESDGLVRLLAEL